VGIAGIVPQNQLERNMYAIIKNRHGEEEARYTLSDTDTLDCGIYAARYANDVGTDFEDGDNVPDSCEDFSVTITENPENAAVCWKSANYCVTWE
jgi:hypothetical protein